MKAPKYQKLAEDESEMIGTQFCRTQGDNPDGTISDKEYDRLFDHLAEVLKKYGSFVEGTGAADFSGYRYVDQIPWITIIPSNDIKPSVALKAGLEAVSTAPRPFIVEFDYYPEELLVMPPANVLSTYSEAILNEK